MLQLPNFRPLHALLHFHWAMFIEYHAPRHIGSRFRHPNSQAWTSADSTHLPSSRPNERIVSRMSGRPALPLNKAFTSGESFGASPSRMRTLSEPGAGRSCRNHRAVYGRWVGISASHPGPLRSVRCPVRRCVFEPVSVQGRYGYRVPTGQCS